MQGKSMQGKSMDEAGRTAGSSDLDSKNRIPLCLCVSVVKLNSSLSGNS
jgi:hypothetical protein